MAESEAGSETDVGYVMEWSADCNDDGIVDYGQILDGSLDDLDGNGIPDCCDDTSCLSAVQWKIEDGGNGHWYQVADQYECWSTHEANALTLGAHLATPTSDQENEFADLLTDTYTFIGLYQQDTSDEPAGGWAWVTGEPLDWMNWGLNEPNDNTNPPSNFGEIWNGGGWNDIQNCVNQRPALYEWSADCNGDGIVDYGQILDGTLEDLNQNGVPDCCDQGYACFPPDCNNNGIDDSIDLANGTSQDCNGNEIPDECDVADGTSDDCNSNNIPDECETLADCDSDGTPDACEILNGAIDANPADGIPDRVPGPSNGRLLPQRWLRPEHL